jgi:hypothetical protein
MGVGLPVGCPPISGHSRCAVCIKNSPPSNLVLYIASLWGSCSMKSHAKIHLIWQLHSMTQILNSTGFQSSMAKIFGTKCTILEVSAQLHVQMCSSKSPW